jgi:hypothetical protein
MLSEQVKKRERYKLEQTRRLKEYLDMIFFPVEHVIRPILKQFMEIDRKKLFLNHVTPQEAPDYHTVIQNPMCFSEIYQKLNSHTYTEMKQFEHDIQLIWQNCMDYNACDTSFYKVANKLKTASVKLFNTAKEKMERLELLDGMGDELIDDSLFEYDASYVEMEPEVVSQQQQEPVAEVDTEEERLQQMERERIREQKERDRRKAIEARVQGRARARALREQNRLKGIVENPAAQKAQLRTLKKLRIRKSPSASVEQPPQKTVSTKSDSVIAQEPALEEILTASNADITSTSEIPKHVALQGKQKNKYASLIDSQSTCTQMEAVSSVEKEPDYQNQRDKEIRALKIIEQPLEYTIAPASIGIEASTTIQSADMMGIDQFSLADNSFNQVQQEQQQPELATAQPDAGWMDIDQVSLASNSFNEVQQRAELVTTHPKHNPPTASSLEPKQNALAKTIPSKRRLKSSTPVPRLTRSAGLQASIEELTKRPKISHEARALFASYNGVSHLDKPVEVYKENRKKHAPIGWVYVDDDEDDNEENARDNEVEVEQALPTSSTLSKPKKPSRNDIPLPNFQKGEIVWAKVNRYPSHPAKVC